MNRNNRRALSLVELLVVMSVILLLLALAAPAIQQIRCAAWAARCKNNLQQFGSAVHQYHADHGMIPMWFTAHDPRYTGPLPMPAYLDLDSFVSIHARILPYLEQHALYDAINWNGPPLPPFGSDSPHLGVFTTLLTTKVAVFLCPADGAVAHWPGAVSYRGSWGVGPVANHHYEFFDSGNGFFAQLNVNQIAGSRFATITDGLSRTSMFSERLVGSRGVGVHDPQRDFRFALENPVSADQTLRLCAAMDQLDTGSYRQCGEHWLYSSIAHTLYTHVLPPNSAISDCGHLEVGFASGGAVTPRSAHPGTVNVCFGDGSVRAVNDKVSLEVWRALGSRNGGEVMLDSSY